MKQETTPHKITKRQEAQDPLTASGRLLALARSSREDLRRLVAHNPNAPLQALSLLAERFPAEVLQNPALALFLLENPQSLLQLDPRALRALLWCEEVSVLILRVCAASQHYELRGIVASCPKTPLDLLQALSHDPSREVRNFVARHPTTDQATLERLCSDRESMVRLPALRRCPSWVASFSALASRLEEQAQRNVTWLSFVQQTPQGLDLQALYRSGGALALQLVALSAETPPALLALLCERSREDHALCSPLLANPHLPKELVPRLLSQLSPGSEELGVFFQENIPEERQSACLEQFCPTPEWLATQPVAAWVYERLFQTKSKELWLQLATNPKLPLRYFQPLFEALDFQIAVELAQNPSTPQPLLEGLAENWRPAAAAQVSFDFTSAHMRSALHRCLAQNPSLPAAFFERLAASGDLPILKSLALNPALPPSLLERLSRAPSAWVRAECAAHPRLPLWRSRELARDQHPEVRQRIAARADLSPEIAHWLWQDEAQIQASLASNPQTPAALLERLARVAPTLVARNPNTPPALLSELSQHPSDVESLQRLVASHANTPAKTLQALSMSANETTKESAFFNPNLSLRWLYQQRYIYEELPF